MAAPALGRNALQLGRFGPARLGTGQRLILEYKLFEPAFYHTDVPD